MKHDFGNDVAKVLKKSMDICQLTDKIDCNLLTEDKNVCLNINGNLINPKKEMRYRRLSLPKIELRNSNMNIRIGESS